MHVMLTTMHQYTNHRCLSHYILSAIDSVNASKKDVLCDQLTYSLLSPLTRRELRIASLHLFTGDQFCDTAIPGIYIRGYVYSLICIVLLMFMPCKQ